MPHKYSFGFLKLLVVLFPLSAGLFLTYMGTAKLNQANETPINKPPSPYGILAFSSEYNIKCELSLYMDEIILKDNWIKAKCISTLSPLKAQTSSYEVKFGFQIPYEVKPIEYDVKGINKSSNKMVETEILDKNMSFIGEYRTSIIYVRFLGSPEFEQYEVMFRFEWRDLVTKQGFSTYDIVVPFSISPNNIVDKYFSDVQPIESTNWSLGMQLPAGSEIRETYPYPEEQTAEGFPDPTNLGLVNYLRWWWKGVLSAGPVNPTSHIIRVRLEAREEEELRNRLLFDSGLYLGLGLGLVISGANETLRFMIERRREGIK